MRTLREAGGRPLAGHSGTSPLVRLPLVVHCCSGNANWSRLRRRLTLFMLPATWLLLELKINFEKKTVFFCMGGFFSEWVGFVRQGLFSP